MKIKPGMIQPAIVESGQTVAWIFTVIVEVYDEQTHLASLTKYTSATEAKQEMRNFLQLAKKWDKPTVPANRTPEICEYCEGNCPNDDEYCCDEYSAGGF